jgi:hypothetical protein
MYKSDLFLNYIVMPCGWSKWGKKMWGRGWKRK